MERLERNNGVHGKNILAGVLLKRRREFLHGNNSDDKSVERKKVSH
jgi:hypothetical protein